MALQSSADTPPSPSSSSFEQVEMSTRIQIDETVISSSSPDEIDGRRRAPAATANNSYQSKKLTAEGMMDLSLLTANANQLKFIIFFNQHSKTFIFALSLIVASLILQVVVGALLIFRRRFKSTGERQRVSLLNEYLVLFVFLITVINILCAVLTTTDQDA